jgi:hypothetical protein
MHPKLNFYVLMRSQDPNQAQKKIFWSLLRSHRSQMSGRCCVVTGWSGNVVAVWVARIAFAHFSEAVSVSGLGAEICVMVHVVYEVSYKMQQLETVDRVEIKKMLTIGNIFWQSISPFKKFKILNFVLQNNTLVYTCFENRAPPALYSSSPRNYTDNWH